MSVPVLEKSGASADGGADGAMDMPANEQPPPPSQQLLPASGAAAAVEAMHMPAKHDMTLASVETGIAGSLEAIDMPA